MNAMQKILFGLGYLAGLVLLGLGAIFLMASPVIPELAVNRAIIGVVMLGAGVAVLVGLRLRQNVVVEQRVTLKPTKIKEMKCKNCSAALSDKDFTIKNDIVIVKCTYCGALYELADEPTW